MQVIALVNQKGGAGKTTILRGLFSAALARGRATALLDTDPTENVIRWAERAASRGSWPEEVVVFHTLDEGEARDFVLGLDDDGDIDLLLVDTAGAASGMHDAVASVSDLVLCPIQPSPSDLETAVGTANWMWRLKGRVEDAERLPAFRAVVNRVGRRPTRAEAGVLRAIRTTPLVGSGPDGPSELLALLPIPIQARDAYRRMDAEGPLPIVIARAEARPERLLRIERHLEEALAEMAELLACCEAVLVGGTGRA